MNNETDTSAPHPNTSPLTVALISGLIVGHFDLFYRLFSPPILMNFRWQEIYQAILIPVALLCVASLPFEVISRIGRSKEGPVNEESTLLRANSFIFSFVVTLVLTTHFLVVVTLGQETLYKKSGQVIFALTCVGCLLLTPFTKKFLIWLCRLLIRQSTKNYALFLVMSAIWMFASDLIDLGFITRADQIVTMKREEKAPKALGVAGPHVLLITLDTMRADMFEDYLNSSDVHPYLSKLVQDSAVFERALSTTSWTLPAHASLLTGQPIHQHGATGKHQMLVAPDQSIAKFLQALGYDTLGFVAGPFCKSQYGLAQNFDYYSDRLDFFLDRHTKNTFSFIRFLRFFSSDTIVPFLGVDGERTAEEINSEVLDFLDSPDAAKNPTFLFLNYFDVHDPYYLRLPQTPRSSAETRRANRLNREVMSLYNHRQRRYKINSLPDDDVAALKQLYQEEIRYLGFHLGEFLESAHQKLSNRDIVTIVTSDHGEEFLEHGGVLHAQTLYNEVLHVPLVVHWPSKVPAQRIGRITSIVDIYDFIHGAVFDLKEVQTTALFQPERPIHRIYASRYARPEYGEAESHALVQNGKKAVAVDPEQERIPNSLFDMESDWGEQNNLLPTEQDQYVQMIEEMAEAHSR